MTPTARERLFSNAIATGCIGKKQEGNRNGDGSIRSGMLGW